MDIDEFLQELVAPNVEEFLRDRGSIRHAINAVWAIDALASHLYIAMKKREKTDSNSDSHFKASRAEKDPEFKIVWDASSAAKHGELTHRNKVLKSSSELQRVCSEGWLAFFSGVVSPDDWGDRIYLANDKFGLRPLDLIVQEAFERLKADCRDFVEASL